LLIAEGAHPRAIMERLGHSSVTISIDVYGHLFASIDESLTDSLDRVFRDATELENGRSVVASDSRPPR
jgi:integrase